MHTKRAAVVLASVLFITVPVMNTDAETLNQGTYITKLSGNHYTYCPVAINTKYNTTTFYCENAESGAIRDYIYSTTKYKKTRKESRRIALSPSQSGWDSVHVCDPSVVAGDFSYAGKHYKYAMFYLGTDQTDNQCNKIGIAYSNNLNGRFLKPDNNIVVDYTYDSAYPDVFQWGVGQPSAISTGNGHVLLFYTKGDMNGTGTYVSEIDLSSFESRQTVQTIKLSEDGVGSFISNADFAYDPDNLTMYMICDKHPFADGTLDCVADESIVYKSDVSLDIVSLENCTWTRTPEANVNYSTTLHDRNHNCGFVRDIYGGTDGIPDILCTVADDSLWQYTIEYLRIED